MKIKNKIQGINKVKAFLGIDVGSISTNLVLIDEKNQLLFSLYIRTDGNPIKAVQNGLKEMKNQVSENIEIIGVGTTGSARYLTGVIVGADLIKNEITAHAKGASFFVPDVKTIIEIGGQDSKLIILENGVAVDFAMNNLCVSKDTKIITENYLPKSINEIKIGEKVLTHQGKFKKVKQKFERIYQSKEGMLKIEISKLKTLKITPEHLILSLKREEIKCYQSNFRDNLRICKPLEERSCNKRCAKHKKFSWKPKFILAKNLQKGDFIVTPLSLENNLNSFVSIDYSVVRTKPKIFRPFKKINKFIFKPELLRLLGYYLAEGNIEYNQARWDKKVKYLSGIKLVFNIEEKNYVKDIKKIILKNFSNLNVRVREVPNQRSVVVAIHSRSLADFIKYLCGSMANKKKLSSELLSLEPFLQKEILKGFFKGDGHFRQRPKNVLSSNKKGNRYCASTVSPDLAYQLYWLLLRNKIKCTLNKSSNKTTGGKYVYFLEVFGEEINKLDNRRIINLKKKCDKSFIYSNWLFEPIRKIEKYNFNGKVYNIEVDADNSYIANLFSVHNCAAGCGAFLDAQASRIKIPIESFGKISLKSKNPTNISGRCTIFSESDMIHKQQVGHPIEDIVAGLCHALVRNYFSAVAKGKNIQPLIVFQGGVSENLGMRKAFEQTLGQKIIVPSHNKVIGAFGVALLVKEKPPERTKFFGFEISDKDIRCDSFQCKGCPNQCEVIEAKIDGKIVSRWGDRCGKWSSI